MRPIVTDLVVWSVGLSVTVVNSAKTAEPIEMPFGLSTRVDPRNDVLDVVPDPPWEGAILSEGKGCAKTAEPMEMSFGLWTWMGPDPYEGAIFSGKNMPGACPTTLCSELCTNG